MISTQTNNNKEGGRPGVELCYVMLYYAMLSYAILLYYGSRGGRPGVGAPARLPPRGLRRGAWRPPKKKQHKHIQPNNINNKQLITIAPWNIT